MPLLVILVLAIVQGITEFLPISSSGHLVLVHSYFDIASGSENMWRDQLLLDIAVHIGTLISVIVYFRKDVLSMIRAGLNLLNKTRGKSLNNVQSETERADSNLMMMVIIASVPILAFGFIIHLLELPWLRKVEIVAWTTLIFGLLLGIADRRPVKFQSISALTIPHALFIGMMQALSLIPGTSRSGITMTAARFLGYGRTQAAHFSLLLAIVATSAVGFLGLYELYKTGDFSFGIDFFLAVTLSFIVGWVSIRFLMTWLERCTFMPFVVYRIILGLVLLSIVYADDLVYFTIKLE
ncbi:MAG: undecaprenyl-diphosphate phosphatase [Alphaproteobacteria bacterium]